MNFYDVNLANALGGGGGGGSTKKTVTGTLANPWGDIVPSELTAAVGNGSAFAAISIDASALGAGTVGGRLGSTDHMYVNGAELTDGTMAYEVTWTSDGDLYSAKMLSGGQVVNISSYASSLTTSLTVTFI